MKLHDLIAMEGEYENIMRMMRILDKSQKPIFSLDIHDGDEGANRCPDCGGIHDDEDEFSEVPIKDPAFIEQFKEPLRIYLLNRQMEIQGLFQKHGVTFRDHEEKKAAHLRLVHDDEISFEDD